MLVVLNWIHIWNHKKAGFNLGALIFWLSSETLAANKDKPEVQSFLASCK